MGGKSEKIQIQCFAFKALTIYEWKNKQLSRKKDKQNSNVSTIIKGTVEMEERENLTPKCHHFWLILWR